MDRAAAAAAETATATDTELDERAEERLSTEILDRQRYRDLGPLGSWTVSTAKPGFDIDRVQDESLETYWQSDGPQPHAINIHFPRKVSFRYVSLYLNFQLDESYTPSCIKVLAGTGYHTLLEVQHVAFNEPSGWRHIDLTQALGPNRLDTGATGSTAASLRLFDTRLLQIQIVSNHQNGKDTHVRAIRIYAPRRAKDMDAYTAQVMDKSPSPWDGDGDDGAIDDLELDMDVIR